MMFDSGPAAMLRSVSVPAGLTVPTICGANVKPAGVSEAFGAGFTVRLIVAVCVSDPDVPVMVTVAGPVVAVEPAVNVITLVPEVGLVLKTGVTPRGSPEAERVTLPVKPFTGVTEIVLLPLPVWVIVRPAGEATSEKSGVAQPANLKLAMRVFQLNDPVVFMYSLVNQKVQSSTGSTVIEL